MTQLPPRQDGRAKLEGRTRYIDDITLPDILHAAFVMSPVHHGRIRRIVFPDGYSLAEFTIISATDIPGANIVPEPVSDEPFLAADELLWRGQPVLAVAHPCQETARAFARAVRIEADELSAIIDPEQAMTDETRVFGREITIDHGPHTVPQADWLHLSRTYRTTHQEQAYLEPQGMLARWDAATRIMHIEGSMQCPYFVKEAVEAILGEAATHVQVEAAEGIGGAFGGKEDFPNVLAGAAALLAWRSGRPVKFVLERGDDLLMTTKRHPSRVTIESWTDRETGRLMKLDIDYRLDAGACQTLSPVVLARGVLHAGGCYACPDVRVRGRLFRSDTPPNGAFRGFGAPQAEFAVEAHVEDVAAALGMEPAEFRHRNLLRVGDRFPTTQPVDEDNLERCYNELLTLCDYDNLRAQVQAHNAAHRTRRGVGLSLGLHGGGYTGTGEARMRSRVKLMLHPDGTAEVLAANTEMGQGAATALAACAAEGLNLPPQRVRTARPDTDRVPNSGPTVASRTIYIVGNMLRRLGTGVREELGGDVAAWMAAHPHELPRTWEAAFEPDPSIVFDEQTYRGSGYKHYSWAACAALIEIDPDTAETRILDMWAVLDVGKLAHADIAEGQAYGGMAQACGWALGEWFFKPGLGRLGGFTDYALPTSMDAPKFHMHFANTAYPICKGLGELPMDFPAPAVRNAVRHALGAAPDEIPLLPERLLSLLRKDEP